MIGRRVLACFVSVLALWVVACGDDNPTGGNNLPPRIVSLNASPSNVILGGQSRVTALVSDPDNDALTILWSSSGGVFTDPGRPSTNWRAPNVPGAYILRLRASDGHEFEEDSVTVFCGNVSLTVESSPSHALITLDGTPTGHTTPHTFDPLAVGFHNVSLFSQYYDYVNQPAIELVHGESDTLVFVLPPSESDALSTGRTDLQEIGGIAFLPSGLGVVYTGRTATETAVFSSSLFPGSGTPRGVRIAGPARIEEPISVGGTGPNLFYVTATESLVVVPIRDLNQDGVVDSVGTVTRLRRAYGPSISSEDQLLYSFTPSEDPSTVALFYADYANGVLTSQRTATPTPGKLPCWKPGETLLTYQRGDDIMYGVLNPNTIPAAEVLYGEGANTSPSWGRWGAKTIGFLHGSMAGTYTDLVITAPGAPEAVTVWRNLADPRFIAWSSLEPIMAVTHHAGGTPSILLVFSLPIP